MNFTRQAVRLIAFVSGLAVSSWAPIVPFAKMRLDLDESLLGFVLLALGIGGLAVMPITGWMVQRFGARNVIFTAGILLVPTLPLLVIAPSPMTLAILLFLYGCSLGVLNVATNAQAIVVETHYGYPMMSGFHCLFSLGGLVGASTVSLLLEMGFHLTTSTIAIAFIIGTIVLTQCRYLQGPKKLPITKDESTSTSTFSFPPPTVLFLGILCFILFLAEGAMLDWSAVFLRSTYDYDISIAGMGYAIFSVAMSIGRFTGDRLVQRFGAINMIQMGGFLAAGGLLFALNFHGAYIELLGFFLVGIGASNTVPILFSAAGRLPNISPSYALTTMTTLGYVGLLLGPAVIGFIAEATSLSISLTGVALLLIAVGISAPAIKIADHSQSEAQLKEPA